MARTSENVRALHVRAVKVPMTEPHRTASGVIHESPLVLVDVVSDEGVTGHGYVFCYSAMALKPTAMLIASLAPLIVGQPLAPLQIQQVLARRFRLLGPQGLAGIAMAAIDMAAWDALARSRGLPLLRLLGAVPRPIPAYGAVGFDGVEGSARVAAGWAKRGFGGVKAKIGYPSVDEDVAVVEAMRAAVGDGVALMVDYNQSLTVAEAIERGRRLDPLGLAWIEEPTLAHDHSGHARIARALDTPVQCGENWWGPLDMRQAIEAGASDLMMPDVMKIGGVSGWMQAAALGAAHGIRLSNHLFVEVSTHLLCATPTAHWLEYAEWFNPIIAEPLRIVDGCAVPAERPGSGIEWDEQAVARFLVH
ncbi:MAG: mandelate racemase [Zoogloeaceae bacterium]|nr:mandelate racemase [Rhodocyclaceae bacterium]MCP5235632.1 mandelate racemase [Zoogloeaceae bacterium]